MTMLRSILLALGAAACLVAFAELGEIPGGELARAMAAVVMGIGVAALVYGEATFASVAIGAASPLAFAALEKTSLAAAAAAMCALWLVPRWALAATRAKLVVLAAVSIGAATVAGRIFATYVHAPWPAHAAACVFAGSCLSLVGIVVPLPTTTAYALRAASAVIDAPIGDVLLHAATAHENSRWQPRSRAMRRQWRTFVDLSDKRAALARASGTSTEEQRRTIDQRLEDIARELTTAPGSTAAHPSDATPSSAVPETVNTPVDAAAAGDTTTSEAVPARAEPHSA